jgi:L-alanine-DL-glutamate epimerase-like enolase superfamily enzyme
MTSLPSLHSSPVYEPAVYIRRNLKMLEACRNELGEEVELIHDVHERVSPTQALQFAKDVERFKLFFLEDLFSPEDIAWFRLTRQQCATPMAMGSCSTARTVDATDSGAAHRLHPDSRLQAGGLPCRKIAGPRSIRREDRVARPSDVSRSAAANVALTSPVTISARVALSTNASARCFGTLIAKGGHFITRFPGGIDGRAAGA